MKKILVLSSAVLLVFSLSSCFKFRNCVCTTNDTATGTFISSSSITTVSHGKKAAESECNSYESADAFTTVTCELE